MVFILFSFLSNVAIGGSTILFKRGCQEVNETFGRKAEKLSKMCFVFELESFNVL